MVEVQINTVESEEVGEDTLIIILTSVIPKWPVGTLVNTLHNNTQHLRTLIHPIIHISEQQKKNTINNNSHQKNSNSKSKSSKNTKSNTKHSKHKNKNGVNAVMPNTKHLPLQRTNAHLKYPHCNTRKNCNPSRKPC